MTATNKSQEKLYMNILTGSVDTLEGWSPYTEKDELVEVEKDENGDWIEVK